MLDDKETWWEGFSLVASNEQKLYVIHIPFSSVERSNKEFQSFVKAAAKVVRRGPELNEKGEIVGERILGHFSEVKAGNLPDSLPHYSVVWTSGANLWKLTGEHLEDVLSLENRLKEEGTNALWKWGVAEKSTRLPAN
jgi:hypothetical protein